jgi:uncharacterized protein (DUF1697 family)
MSPKAAATRYVAFLRALNVGGHIVKMDRLKKMFEALGFRDVKTFIASGNVLFTSSAPDTAALEARIANHLEKELGYQVATFIRSAAEVKRIAAGAPAAPTAVGMARASVHVGFFAESFRPEARKAVQAFRTEVDDFHVDQRELYWSCRISVMDSKVTFSRLEKTLGGSSTFRNANTNRRIAAILE